MQNYKDVCGGKESVWFEIKPTEGKKFLKWAKDLGCVWVNGEEIEVEKGSDFFHLSIDRNGNLANVPISAWVSKQLEFKNVDRYVFSEYLALKHPTNKDFRKIKNRTLAYRW